MSKKQIQSVVTERGQITLPKSIRDQAGIMPGSILIFQYQDGKITISKDINKNPVANVYGCLKNITPYRTTDEYMTKIRGPAK